MRWERTKRFNFWFCSVFYHVTNSVQFWYLVLTNSVWFPFLVNFPGGSFKKVLLLFQTLLSNLSNSINSCFNRMNNRNSFAISGYMITSMPQLHASGKADITFKLKITLTVRKNLEFQVHIQFSSFLALVQLLERWIYHSRTTEQNYRTELNSCKTCGKQWMRLVALKLWYVWFLLQMVNVCYCAGEISSLTHY